MKQCETELDILQLMEISWNCMKHYENCSTKGKESGPFLESEIKSKLESESEMELEAENQTNKKRIVGNHCP